MAIQGSPDSWKIRELDDTGLAKTLRDRYACEEALGVAITEALARILERGIEK